MKIAVLSDCRLPTTATGGHGLGRMAWDMATGLAERHAVRLYAGPDSDVIANCSVHIHADETHRARQLAMDHIWQDFDAIIDLSHLHDLSQLVDSDRPILNWLVDTECGYPPPNAVVGNTWQARDFARLAPPLAAVPLDAGDAGALERTPRIVPLGIDVDAIPLNMGNWGEYLAYAAKIHELKGYDLALEVHQRQSIPVRFVGERFVDTPLPWHVEALHGADFYAFLGKARGLLSPSRLDAGGRVNLEAAACGTPVLCLDGTGTAEHVAHGVSGFICRNTAEMADAVQDLPSLDRKAMRAWVRETHDLSVMVRAIEALCMAVADGETW